MFDATYTKPIWDTLDPGQSASGSITQAYNNFSGIQAQLSVVNAKYTAEKYDGGQLNNAGGSAAFFGQALRTAVVTAGVSALAGPGSGAAAGAMMAGRDAANFATSAAPQPQGREFYTLANSLTSVREAQGYDPAAEYTDGGTGHDYVDFSNKRWISGFAAPSAGSQPQVSLMSRKVREGDDAQLRGILNERDTLIGKLAENDRQGLTTNSQTTRMDLTNIDRYVGQGWKPPTGPAFTV